MTITRRNVISAITVAPALLALAPRPATAQFPVPALPETPECGGEPHATPRSSEGPYYSSGSPRRHDIAFDVDGGTSLLVAGFVLSPDCRPVPGAVVEIWQADHLGRYDNSGFRLRGHESTDAAGRWWFATVEPAVYPGRTRHLHVKVAPPGGRVLTTQLYFPGEAANARDRLFDERLLLDVSMAGNVRFGRFDFVVA